MSKIKNMGTSTAKFSEGVIIDGLASETTYGLIVTGSIFANSLTGSVNGLATSATNDSLNNKLLGGINFFENGLFQNPTSNLTIVYFPADDSLIEAAIPSTTNFYTAPYDGQLMKITMKSSLNLSATNLTCSFHTGSNGSSAYSETAAATSTADGLVAWNTYTFDFSQNPSAFVNAGDIYGFSLKQGVVFNGTGNYYYNIHIKFDSTY